METPPLYTAGLSLKRILIPKSLTLLFLGGLLYLGVAINLYILNITIPTEWHLSLITGITLLILIQAILNYITFSNFKYYFYNDKIIFIGKKQIIISYSQIQGLSADQDSFDKFFNTGSIFLSPMHKMMAIENTNQLYFYLQKLLELYRQNYAYYQRQQYTQTYNPYKQQQYPSQNQNEYYNQQIK